MEYLFPALHFQSVCVPRSEAFLRTVTAVEWVSPLFLALDLETTVQGTSLRVALPHDAGTHIPACGF